MNDPRGQPGGVWEWGWGGAEKGKGGNVRTTVTRINRNKIR